MPRLNGSEITCAPCAPATSTVPSLEPSETTTTSSPGSSACSSSSTRPTFRSSLNAGTIATRLSAASGAAVPAGVLSTSVDMCPDPYAGELQQSPRAVPVGVFVEDPLARATAELFGLRGIVQEVAIGGDRLGGVTHDEQLASGLEPALDALVRI